MRSNRSPQLSDESLVDKMKANLAADGYKFRAWWTPSCSARNSSIAASPTRPARPKRRRPQPPGGKLIKDRFPEGALT